MLYQDEELAADFCQELFMKLYKNAKSFDSNKKFSTWLYTIAANMCKNEYRRQSRMKPTFHLDESKILLASSPPSTLDESIFQKHLEKAINKLNEKHRLCFILRYREAKSVSEISEMIDIPAGTVKSRLHHALKNLSAELSQFNPKQKKASNE